MGTVDDVKIQCAQQGSMTLIPTAALSPVLIKALTEAFAANSGVDVHLLHRGQNPRQNGGQTEGNKACF